LNCPVKAISERNEKGFSIEQARCVGCAVCLVHCPYHAIEVSWAGSARELAEKMMEYALAVVSQVRYKYFFNLCIRITKECDCLAKDEAAVVPDIGICASEDPVAIDKASLDLVFKASRKDIFSRLHPEAYSCLKQLEYAQDLGLGSLDYELIQTQ
jgi:uncharacterized Fe-S center protein